MAVGPDDDGVSHLNTRLQAVGFEKNLLIFFFFLK